jgi:hypothetical protein
MSRWYSDHQLGRGRVLRESLRAVFGRDHLKARRCPLHARQPRSVGQGQMSEPRGVCCGGLDSSTSNAATSRNEDYRRAAAVRAPRSRSPFRPARSDHGEHGSLQNTSAKPPELETKLLRHSRSQMPVPASHMQGPHTVRCPQALMHNILCLGVISTSIQWSAMHWRSEPKQSRPAEVSSTDNC